MAIIVPPIPSNFQVQQGNGQVLVSWDVVPGATQYELQRSTDGVNYALLASLVPNTYLDTSVTVGTAYFYKVAATNAQGTGNYTSPLQIVPAQSGLLSLQQLRQMTRERADRVNSDFVTDSELNTYINQSAYELYDLLTTLYEDYYAAPPLLITTNGSANQYELPNGVNHGGARPFYKLLGVDLGLNTSGNAWVTVHKFDFMSRNRFVFPNIASTYFGVFNLRYRLFGNTLFFIPTPSSGQYVRIWYVPRMQQLLQDTDLLEGVSGWTEYVIIDAAIKMMQKEESDVTVLALQKQAIIERINTSAMNRDAAEPDTISNVRPYSQQWGHGPGSDGSYGGF